MQDYQRLLASQSVRRLNPAKVSESAALKTKLVDTIAFLESLAVKDSNEKDIFFKRLPATLPSLPLPVVQKKVLSACCVSVHALYLHSAGKQVAQRTQDAHVNDKHACLCSSCPCWPVHWSLAGHRRWRWEPSCKSARH